MKKLILTSSLVTLVAASSFGQAQVSFKTTITKDPVYTSTDGTTASLALIPTTGQAGSFGTVFYEIYAAPTGTAAPTVVPTPTGFNTLSFGTGWTVTDVGPVVYSSAGIINPAVSPINLPSQIAAGSTAEIEVIAYTGTLAAPTLYGYSGMTLPSSVTTAGLFTWNNATGNPNAVPTPIPAVGLQSGTGSAGGLGSIVLEPVGTPEPTTLAIGGIAAAALLAFRRRK